MAQHASAEKRQRQNEKRRARNAAIRSQMRAAVKTARTAIGSNVPNVGDAVKQATTQLFRAASKGILPKKNVSRRVSRLMKSLSKTTASKS